jgi:hypothetical protein
MGKRAWLVFAAIQLAGCVFAGYGTVYSESAPVRLSWLLGFLLLLPGNLPAQAVSQALIHVRTDYVFIPVAVASNAILWITLSGFWRMLRQPTSKGSSYRYRFALALACLTFVVANTIHFLRTITCSDCFFSYGVPFTLYHDGGFAGGAGVAWTGLAADAGCVVAAALIVGRVWEALVLRHKKQSRAE